MNRYRALLKYFLLTLFAVGLAGCSSLDSRDGASRYEGRFSASIPDASGAFQNASGSFTFLEKNETGRLTLTSSVGIRIAEIDWNEGSSTIRIGNREPVEAAEPESALSEALGIRIPVKRFSSWLTRAPIGQHASEAFTFEEDGWVVNVRQRSENTRLVTANQPELGIRVRLLATQEF